MWIKNSEGKPDAVLTMTFVSFIFIVLKLLVSNMTFVIGDFSMSFGALDAGLVAALLTPTFGSYVARRYTDKKANVEMFRMTKEALVSLPDEEEEIEEDVQESDDKNA